MKTYSLENRTNDQLRRDLDARFQGERIETAELVAHIAEFDARGLYKEAGYDSMHDYCMKIGRLSEDAAYRRLTAARTARKHPGLFTALADGRLNLSAICLLAPHLTEENAAELVTVSACRSNAEIRDWLVARMITRSIESTPARVASRQLEMRTPSLALTRVEARPKSTSSEPAPLRADPESTAPDAGPAEFEMRFTISREDEQRFRYLQALMSHAIPSGDVAAVYRRAVDALIAECEKRKYAVSKKPQGVIGTPKPTAKSGHHIPAHVRRAVWVRDRGRCTWVSPSGHRCGARKLLEFDHILPVARGGRSTMENVRLRCRAHNQMEANRVLGTNFMKRKRREAAIAAAVQHALPSCRAAPPRGP